MNNDTPQPPSSTDAPPFPHQHAIPPLPLEAAERQYGERPPSAPSWQPDDGDFT